MSMTDPIADLLTRIRNANKAGFESVDIPHSKLKEAVVHALQESGYVNGFEVIGSGIRKSLVVSLKYKGKKERVIEGLVKVSKPGKRVYRGYDEITPVRGGMGVAIFSTPKGVLTDENARKQKLGGEWLCSVW